MPNRLAAEKSPYLRQHADNPVDWFPWGDEALAEARRLDKPIFLSIGYSTCHWCHVMERESFEDEEIASALNREFVSIKVDREERPDIDRVYMLFVQATSGSGGWPMSVWLTPDLRPFFGGTYFPPRSHRGSPGFLDVLREIARAWRTERRRLLEAAWDLTERLRRLPRAAASGTVPDAGVLAHAVADFVHVFDREHGGFGGAPKFPRPSELLFLLRETARTGHIEARRMALETLQAMACGGIYDHVGGGFHRYAVDAGWRVPHFEKMLYDQAQLTLAYLEALQVTGDPVFGRVAADTLAYVRRDLTDPAGGFYSAEDADSLPEGAAHGTPATEGAFYVWSQQEIGARLGPDAAAFGLRFGVRPEGNAPTDPHGAFGGRNILHVARPITEVARLTGRAEAELAASLDRDRAALRERRSKRPRPRLDDKVLTAWNGLMIAACARAYRVLGDPEDLTAAERAAAFIKARLWDDASGRLLRRYRDHEAAIDAYAEDYAFLIFGLLELFQAGCQPEWLEWAVALQATLDDRFGDHAEGGWFSTTGQDASVLLRMKEEFDGAEPAASSIAAWNALVLHHLGVGEGLGGKAEAALRLFGGLLAQTPRAMPMMLAALSTYWNGLQQVVIVGDRRAADTRALVAAVNRVYLPFAVVIFLEPGAHQNLVARLIPAVGNLPMQDGRATAYVCRDFACRAPATDVEALTRQLMG